MGKAGLTDKQVRYMEPGEKRKEVPAGPPGGLFLVLHPSGRKSWILRYRFRGGTRGMTLQKPYPELSLAQARAEAKAALQTLRGGEDPATKAAEESKEPSACQAVADEWIERDVKGTRTCKEVRRILDKDILPEWKRKHITEVGRADVLRLVDSIVDRGAPVLANRTLSILKRWFGWLMERGYVEASPVAGLRPPGREESRDRVLTDAELVEVWKAAGELGYPFGPYVRFLILTAQRRGEVAGMRWQDVDLEKKLWTLPAEQTKPGRVHDVPLSGPALEIVRNLPRFPLGPCGGCGFVEVEHLKPEGKRNAKTCKRFFQCVFTTTSGKRPVSGFSKMKLALDGEDPKVTDWHIHDLRRTAATMMAKAGVAPHVLAAILNHTPGSTQGVTMIYNRFRYLDERRAALEQWGKHVTELAEPKRKIAAVRKVG